MSDEEIDSSDSTEEDYSISETKEADRHVTIFLKMIQDPTNEIFFYHFEKKDQEVFTLVEKVLVKFFSYRKDKLNFTIPFQYTFCYMRTPRKIE